MHPHAQLIQSFYAAFQRRDADAMIACYHPDIWFSDPAFGDLRGPRAGAMWRMLCQRASSLEIAVSDVHADDRTGRAHWEPRYLFSATGRQVHNRIDATFELRDGKIIRHADHFDLWRWSRMALGAKGALLGWLPPVQRSIRARALRGLEAFEREQR
jgi:ketosteroid isomerase-like protein